VSGDNLAATYGADVADVVVRLVDIAGGERAPGGLTVPNIRDPR
jgi:hypothetical protein